MEVPFNGAGNQLSSINAIIAEETVKIGVTLATTIFCCINRGTFSVRMQRHYFALQKVGCETACVLGRLSDLSLGGGGILRVPNNIKVDGDFVIYLEIRIPHTRNQPLIQLIFDRNNVMNHTRRSYS